MHGILFGRIFPQKMRLYKEARYGNLIQFTSSCSWIEIKKTKLGMLFNLILSQQSLYYGILTFSLGSFQDFFISFE